MFKAEHCSPRKGSDNTSCMDIETLKNIARIINKNPKSNKIDLSSKKRKLYNDISDEKKKVSDCDDELCWIIEDGVNGLSENVINQFRPIMPQSWENNKTQWLNTNDINNVMNQYEEKYPDFKYLGANPIDFNLKSGNECIAGGDICNINLNELDKSINKIGMVFNIDPSTKSGQHWFSLYVDLKGINRKTPTIYYFDSAKKVTKKNLHRMIPKEIKALVKKLKKQDDKLDFLFNDKKHQYKNTECGVYSIHFLTEMLQGKSFQKYVNRKLDDENMEDLRSKFFIERK
jgi:hypothetical protein